MPSRWRGALTRGAQTILLLGVASLMALLLGEALVRLFAPQQLILIRPDLWQPADSLGWLRRPDASGTINTGEREVTVRSDREGFRVGRDGRREAPVQVLVIGDSFMEALQVEYEQSTAGLLDSALNARPGPAVVVRNAGVAGWSLNQYLTRTRQLLARDTFRLVVVAVFVGNDATPTRVEYTPPRAPVERHALRLPRGLSSAELKVALFAPINDALEVRSHLYILFKNQMATLRMRLGITADYFPLEYRRSEAESPRWQTTGRLARDLAQAARARGVPTLFVLIPERIQVYEEDLKRYLLGFDIDSSTVDIEQPTVKLLEALAAQGLPNVVDALPAFRAAAREGPRLFGMVDQHLSPEGHRVLARVIAPEAERLLRR